MIHHLKDSQLSKSKEKAISRTEHLTFPVPLTSFDPEPQFIYPDRWGAWSILIHYWAVLLLESDTFPAYHPLSFFPDRVQSVKAQEALSAIAPS